MDAQINETVPRILITPDKPATRHDQIRKILPDAPTLGSQGLKPAPSQAQATAKSGEGQGGGFWGDDGFTFGDILDLINPLQHIPGVSTVYRAITGDEIGTGPRIFGGAILGGVVGAGIAAANAALEHETGKDVGEHAIAALGGVGNKAMQLAGMAGAGEELHAAASSLAPLPELAKTTKEVASAPSQGLPIVLASAEGSHVNDVLGSVNAAHQQYRQTQFLDMLNEAALEMQA